MILDVHVTTRCNLRCRHCYLKDLKAEDRRDMDLDTFAELLIDASLHSVKTFILSGGEPLYHKNFEEIYHAYKLPAALNFSLTSKNCLSVRGVSSEPLRGMYMFTFTYRML